MSEYLIIKREKCPDVKVVEGVRYRDPEHKRYCPHCNGSRVVTFRLVHNLIPPNPAT